MTDLKARLNDINRRLKAEKCPARIYESSGRLSLQATLPPVPDSRKVRPYQQRIALRLPLTEESLMVAEVKARELGVAILTGTFDWDDWGRRSVKTCAYWIDRFEADYFLRRARTPKTETTWRHDYEKIFKKLPPEAAMTERVLMDVIFSTAPDTRTRQRACRVLAALAGFAGVPLNAKPYKGSYGLRQLQPRDLPTDEEIIYWRNRIGDPNWQWVYGCLAAYGLRPHEICYLTFNAPPRADITDGKTGARFVFPFHPEWFEEWDLATIRLPKISGRTNSDKGNRVTHAFNRFETPFSPMDLRHCWAARTVDYIEPVLAAQEMGHSLEMHNKTYHHWISARYHQEAFERAIRRRRS